MTLTEEIIQARCALSAARIALRHILHDEKQQRKAAEERAYSDGHITGSNQAMRDIQLANVLAEDALYQASLAKLMDYQDRAEALTAELEGLVDKRAEREWSIRDKLADAMILQAHAPLLVDAQGHITVPIDGGALKEEGS